MMESCLYLGDVVHKRLRPVRHRFRYRVFSLLLDLDEIDRLPLRWFAHNRFALFSLFDRDHGPRDGSPLRPWVEAKLADAGLDGAGGAIRLLCFPRLLGYVFNPLSIYFCHHRDGRLLAILYEVKNTFGDQHGYLFPVDRPLPADGVLRQRCAKGFYVSPFIGMDADYRFRIQVPGDRLAVLIRETVPDGEVLIATLTGRRAPLNDRSLLRAWRGHPLMTIKVIVAIHWEAFRLFLKGAVFHHRPAPPSREVTYQEHGGSDP